MEGFIYSPTNWGVLYRIISCESFNDGHLQYSRDGLKRHSHLTMTTSSSTGAKLAGVAFLAGVGMTLVALRSQSIGNDRVEEDDADDSRNKDEGIPFLWEPKSTTNSQDQQQQSNFMCEKRKKSHQQEQKELDFLSTMTFANGGLRAPNCVCCR